MSENTAGELIARLEAATEGSRVLDVLVRNCAEGIEGHDRLEEDVAVLDRSGWPLEEIPHYTTSLDAAMTLVPDGMGWNAGNTGDAPCFGLIQAKPYHGPLSGKMYRGNAPTAPLALCIAALKARTPAVTPDSKPENADRRE